MANVDIDVGGKTLNVDIDGLESMSPDQQQAAVATVARQLASSSSEPQAAQQAAPTPAPATPQATPDESFTGALGQGLHNAAQGFGRTLQVVGDAAGSTSLSAAGKSVAGAMGAPQGYRPTDMAGALREGRYGDALRQLPRAAVEAAPDLAGALASGAVGSVAGPVGTAAGVAAYSTGRNLGENAQGRAENNGRSTPDASDLIGGGLTTAAGAALDVAGLGKLPGTGRALSKLSAIRSSATKVGMEGSASAAGDAVQQVGRSVGTDEGLQYDPYQSAAAGLQGAAARAGGEVIPLARAGIKEGVDRAVASTMEGPASVADAQSIARVRTLAAETTERAQATRGDTAPTAVMNNVKNELVNNIAGYATKLRDGGLITPAEYRTIKNVAENQAQRQNNTIAEGGPDGPSTLFDAVNKLNLPDEAVSPLVNAIRDLNTASSQSFQKNQVGPFAALGKLAGQGTGLALGVASGNPYHMAGAIAGHGLSGHVGKIAGSALDRVLGTATPSVQLRARKADAMLRQVGIEEGPSSLRGLQDASAAVDEVAPVVAQAGTRAKAGQTVEEYNRQAQADFAAAAERDQADIDRNTGQADKLKESQMDTMQRGAERQDAERQANLAASAAASDKAQAIVEKQRGQTVEDYLSGRSADPEVVPVGKQTAAEIALNNQRLRNQAAALRDGQRAMKVGQQSQDQSVDGQAQALVDRASRSNAATLAAEQLAPTERAGVDETAIAATMAQTAGRAARVRAFAESGADAADRIAVGNPPYDPVPVNTPLKADGTPIQEATQQPKAVRVVAPKATPVSPSPEAPQAAQRAPEGLPEARRPAPENTDHDNWRAFTVRGHKITEAQIEAGVNELVANGTWTPQAAQKLLDHMDVLPNAKAILKPLQEVLGTTKPAPVGLPGEDRGPIRDRERWDAATADYQAHAAAKMELAEEHPALKAVILNIRDEVSATEKAQTRDDYIAPLAKRASKGDKAAAAELALAQQLLSGPLMRSKKAK